MKTSSRNYVSDESGAVTVDWVVLGAAVVGLALLALMPVATGAGSMAQHTADAIGNTQIGFD